MNVLLLRPDPGNERFGLGPFFRVEPLGLEYIGAALHARGHAPAHHVLWEPRLGAKRFFELYAETWRRSILNTAGEKGWLDWMRQVKPSQIPYLTRVLLRTQRVMKTGAYLQEHNAALSEPLVIPGEAAPAS